jgi:acetyl-CoA carboxylase carboxyltransferase component
VLIFVCITPTAQLRKLRAQGIQALIDACDDWIDANIKISEERDAISLGLRILNDSTANQSEVVQTAGSEGKR